MRPITKSEFQERMDRIRSELKSVGAFEDVSPQARAERKRRARTDIFYFGSTYFPQMFYLPFEDVDAEVVEMAYVPNTLALVDVFRGYAKSTFFSFLIPMHEICFPDLHNMHFFISYSDTELQAASFTGPMHINLRENERIRADFGDLVLAGAEHDFTTTNEQWILARGYKQRVRGLRHRAIWRPDRVTIDDLEDDESIRNPRLVKKRIERVERALIPAMSGENYYMTWAANNLSRKSAMAHFLDAEEETTPGVKKYQSYSLRPLDSEGKPTCPQRFPMHKIDRIKKSIGTRAWNAEYMGLHEDESDAFREAWFRYYRPDIIAGVPMRIVIGVDASIDSETKTSEDYRAVIAVGMAGDYMAHVLSAWIRRASENIMWEAVFRMCLNYLPSPTAWPGQPHIQSLKLVIGGAKTEEHLKKHWMQFCERKHSCPAYPKFNLQQSNKILRIIDTLSHPFETGNILLPWPMNDDVKMLKEQLIYIENNSVNDDGPDALREAFNELQTGATKFEYHTIEESRYENMAM